VQPSADTVESGNHATDDRIAGNRHEKEFRLNSQLAVDHLRRDVLVGLIRKRLRPEIHDASAIAFLEWSNLESHSFPRDFWDLQTILTRTPRSLDGVLAAYRKKFAQHDVGHVVRSLAYFADADAEPMPDGLDVASWNALKRDLERWVLELAAR
jgi:hypothetical protein